MPSVRMLSSGASECHVWDCDEVVEMTPAEASVWADGVRGELVRPQSAVENPEATSRRRQGGFSTPETRRR